MPIVAAVVAFFGADYIPSLKTSVAYIGPLDETSAKNASPMIRSTRVLDAVLQKFPDYPGPNWNLNDRRRYLDRRLQWGIAKEGDVKRSSSVYVLTVEDYDPLRAQALASSLIDNWLLAMKPAPDERARLERMLDAAKDQYVDVSEIVQVLKQKPDGVNSSESKRISRGEIADLLKLRAETVSKIEELKAMIEGSSRDWVFAGPTPGFRSGLDRPTIAVASAAAALALVFGLICFQLITRTLSKDPRYSSKLERLGFSAEAK